jgi:hypothetical protein
MLLLGACAPALDWRELRPQGAAVRAQFPCKPRHAERELPLPGAAGRHAFHLHACTHEGMTFALGAARLPDAAAAGPALERLQQSLARNMGGRVLDARPLFPPGATVLAQSQRFTLEGRSDEGKPLVEQAWVFAKGEVVMQAVVLAEAGRFRQDWAQQFFDALDAR